MSESIHVPKGWIEASIGQIAKSIQYGHTASATNDLAGPRFLRITDIQNGQVDWCSVPSCAIAKDEVPKYRLNSGDIVFARTGATTGKSFLISDCPEAVFASYLIRLRMCDGIIPRYVQAFFQTNDYWRQIEGGKRGIGQPNVNATVLGSIRIPIAPPNEQRRIVVKIEELFSDLDAGVAALERAKANLKRYRAAVLKAAVEGKLTEQWRAEHPNTEPASKLLERVLTERRKKWEADQLAKFAAAGKEPPKNWRAKYVEPSPPDTNGLPELPKGWNWATANQLCTQITDGEHIQPPYQEEGFPMLTATHVRNGHVEFNDVGYISESDFRRCLQRCAPTYGDILIVSVGATTGRAGQVQECPPFALVRSVLLLKPIVLGAYLLDWIQSPWCQAWIVRASGASAQAHFYISDTKRMPVPLPPHAEQVEIASEVDRYLSSIVATECQIHVNIQRAVRLRQSILKQAFEGKLVPQDPTDEPASVLLERLRIVRSSVGSNGQSPLNARGRQKKSSYNAK